jgi:hypothetical protein
LADGLREAHFMDGAILLIDNDLGQAFRLGRALDHAGFQTFPARTIADAIDLLSRLHLTVDILLLDCNLLGAEEFIGVLQSGRRVPRVICLNRNVHSCIRGADMASRAPADLSDDSIAQWVREIREMLLCYSLTPLSNVFH